MFMDHALAPGARHSYLRGMGMIRSLISMALLGLFLIVGFTVPVGELTLFGHERNIWASNEAQ